MLRERELKLPSDGTVVTIREPKAKEGPRVMRALQPLVRLQNDEKYRETGFVPMEDMISAISGDDAVVHELLEIIAILTGKKLSEIEDMGWLDINVLIGTVHGFVMPYMSNMPSEESAEGEEAPLVKTTRSSSRSTKAR